MRARRTPWWHYVVACALGLLAGIGLARYSESSDLSLIGAPWIVSVLLGVLGITVLILALQVHKYATTDPRKRADMKPLNPDRAVNTLVLAKALGLAGAALVGWYGGQIIMIVGHIEAAFYTQAVAECAVAAVVCLADMIIGLVGEWLCQLPPSEGAEHPKMKEAQRRHGVSPATAKTSN